MIPELGKDVKTMPAWTPSQSNAIHAKDLSLLVSAGAGSGKTTVLTQRIIERIRNGDSVTDFLVVTFTKASASDLRGKLYEAIVRLSAQEPGEKRYRTQLYLLPNAHISTIHAYCLEVVRANFQILGLSPTVRMADEEESRMLASDVMETVTDEFYEADDEAFGLLADTFSGTKDDGPLTETMLELYGRLRAYADYFGWLETRGNALLADAARMREGLFGTEIGKKLQGKLIDWFTDLADAADALYAYVASAADTPKCLETAELWRQQTRLLAESVKKSYSEFASAAEAFRAVSFPRISYGNLSAEAKRFYGAERDRIKKEVERLLERFAVGTEEEFAQQFALTGRVLLAARTFLQRFESLYDAAKREKGVMDFPDAEHFLLRLLEQNGEPTPLCLSLRGKIKELYIDEYQDVSPLQDRLFALLSDGSNRFMVGDVKQSIYRFRNAYPDIFLDYKDRFPDFPPEGGTCARVFLRENFRSGEKILRFVNLLFSHVTAGTAYEREYKGEELLFAKQTDAPQLPVTVAVALHDDRSKTEATEQEAEYIAEEILRLLESGKKETPDGPAPYRYRDVVLLFRALKNATTPYERALKKRGIPYTITTLEPFFEQPEILLILAALKAIDDPTDDISLFAWMRSPMAGFSAEELYAVRQICGKGPLYRAVQHAAEAGDALAEKCAAFLSELAFYRERAEGSPCHTFLWELYTRSGLLHLCTRKEKNGLLMLYEYARKFETTGYKGLSGLLSYLKAAEEKGVELPGSGEAGDGDRVTLTTIHKSKGLEYPAVFLCGCDRALFPNLPKKYILLRGEGLFFKLRDYDRLTVTDTLPHRYAALAERDAELGEELRKLYVACTRAREKLYITGAVQRKAYESGSFNPRAPRCLLDLVLSAAQCRTDDCFELTEIAAEEAGVHRAAPAVPTGEGAVFLTSEAEAAIRFVYPFQESALPAKISVSELKERLSSGRAEVEYGISQLTRAPAFMDQVSRDAADAGTANHLFLQFCRFEQVEQYGIHEEADRLLRRRMMKQSQVELLDFKGLEAFFRSDLYARMRASTALYREQRFSVRAPAAILGANGGDVLLQGVIDCFFAGPDGTMTVVDYKTDRVREASELKTRHALQLACYRYAVEAITGKRVAGTSIWSFCLGREVWVANESV